MLLVKVIVLLLLGFIVISLFSGLVFLVKDKGQTNRTVNALTFRIGLSILAIVVVLIAAASGLIELNPSPVGTFEGNITEGVPASSSAGPEDAARPQAGGRRRLEDSGQ